MQNKFRAPVSYHWLVCISFRMVCIILCQPNLGERWVAAGPAGWQPSLDDITASEILLAGQKSIGAGWMGDAGSMRWDIVPCNDVDAIDVEGAWSIVRLKAVRRSSAR